MKKSEVAQVYKGADEKSWQELLDDLRPQGEWIHYLGCGIGKAICSKCGQLGETKKYCGNCGADMRGKEE